MKHIPSPLELFLPLLLSFALACGEAAVEVAEPSPQAESRRLDYALAIHGGAGVIPRTMEVARQQEYFDTLREALALGRDLLEEGGHSLDVVEQVVRRLEDSPLFNAGKGAVFTHDGGHELDAAIMDGRTLDCGSVAGVTTVKNPITLARRVMERSRHVFLVAGGAERFADEVGVERVDPEYFFVQRRYDQWQRALEEAEAAEAGSGEGAGSPEVDGAGGVASAGDDGHRGTVGAVALDRHGDLAAATSTGGLTDKRYGRVGDVPIIGAGTYADNRTCAVSGTGLGEQFIRHGVAHAIAARMAHAGLGLEAATREVVFGELDEGDGGVIAVDRLGNVALVFSSEGMFRGSVSSESPAEVRIWE